MERKTPWRIKPGQVMNPAGRKKGTHNKPKSKLPIDLNNRLTLSVTEFKGLTGLGHTFVNKLIRDGRLKSKLVDGRRILDKASALELVLSDNS